MQKIRLVFALCLLMIVVTVTAADLTPGELVCTRCNPFPGDFDGDGLDDLLAGTEILFNTDGAFAPGVAARGLSEADFVRVVADLTGDRLADVIVAQRSPSPGPGQPGGVPGPDRLLINVGPGEFVPGSPLPAGNVQQVADFTGDGTLDLVLSRREGYMLAAGVGNGRFVEWQLLPYPDGRVEAHREPYAIGDLNGDGRPELVLPRRLHLFIYFAGEDGRYRDPVKRYTHFATFDPAIADVNGDAKNDLVLISSRHAMSRVTVLFGDGAGRFPRYAHKTLPMPELRGREPEVRSLVVGDFYAGGSNEIAAGLTPGYVTVLSAMGDQLDEVARLDAPRLRQPQVTAGHFRRGGGLDLWILGSDGWGPVAQVVFANGTLAPTQSAHEPRWRVRAVRRLIAAPGAGEYEVSVSGGCPIAIGGSWTFVREGLFIDVQGVRGLVAVEAAVADDAVAATPDEIYVRLVIDDLGKTRVLEGGLVMTGPNRLSGKLFEDNPPCGGLWTMYEVEAVR